MDLNNESEMIYMNSDLKSDVISNILDYERHSFI